MMKLSQSGASASQSLRLTTDTDQPGPEGSEVNTPSLYTVQSEPGATGSAGSWELGGCHVKWIHQRFSTAETTEGDSSGASLICVSVSSPEGLIIT